MGGLPIDEQGDFAKAIKCCNKALSIQEKTLNIGTTNKIRVTFCYVSMNGLIDQSFYSYEKDGKNTKEAVQFLQDVLAGGLGIRIDKTIDLSPKTKYTMSLKLKEKFNGKSRIQIFIIVFGSVLLIIAALSKFLNRML